MRERAVERTRHPAEVEGFHERPCERDLPVGEKTAELLVERSGSVRRLLLIRPKGTELAVSGENLLDRIGAERANDLVLEIRVAIVEAHPFHLLAAEIETDARASQRPPQEVDFAGVAETCQPDVCAVGAVPLHEPAHRLRPADREDANPFGGEIPTTSERERLQGDSVARSLDQHNGIAAHHHVSLTLGVRIGRVLPGPYAHN